MNSLLHFTWKFHEQDPLSYHIIIIIWSPAESLETCWMIKFPSFMISPALFRPRISPCTKMIKDDAADIWNLFVIPIHSYLDIYIYLDICVDVDLRIDIFPHCVSRQSHEPWGLLEFRSQNRRRPPPATIIKYNQIKSNIIKYVSSNIIKYNKI